MAQRIIARLLTSPAAFLVAAGIDLLSFAIAARRARARARPAQVG